ncbi:MAG: RNA 3'-terminal phosphate cyclase [Candidatus Micrarchaeia archaeon]
MIELDGSVGEGGGQVLRTALSLSMLSGEKFRVCGVRAKRVNPGLQAQHLAAVSAAASVCGARVEGAVLRSRELFFEPGRVRGGEYFFDVGTAGSAMLVLQTVLPALLFARESSRVVVRGGTWAKFAPPHLFFERVFLKCLSFMGVSARFSVEKWGWFPAGGGVACLEVVPVARVKPFRVLERGPLAGLSCVAAASLLPSHVTRRMKVASSKFFLENGFRASVEELRPPADCAGAGFFVEADYESCVAGFDCVGEKGVPAEEVALKACRDFLEFHSSNAACDAHLADQLLPYCALASGESIFTTAAISSHLRTNAEVIARFLPAVTRLSEGLPCTVSVQGAAFKPREEK